MSGIEAWSTTAASNNSASPNGAPEGMAPSGVNDTIRQNMASIRTWYENPQWINLGYTHTYASTTSFTIATTDYTSTYHAGRRIKAVGTSTGTIYGTVTSSSYSSSTTVNISWDSGTLQNETLTISIGLLTNTNSAVPYLNKQSADVASATTIDLNAIRGELVDVTGTTTITTVTLAQGHTRILRFTGILTFTHGASLVLPTSANITTAAGDYAIVSGYASSVVRCVGYFRADGTALTPSTSGTNLALSGKLSTTSAGTLTIASGVVTATGSKHLLETEGAAATDDLDTINGGADGMRIVVGSVADARNIIIKHNTGNIYNPAGVDMVLETTNDKVEAIYDSTLTKWFVLGGKYQAPIIIVRCERTSGTGDGTPGANPNTRVLNATQKNTISGASLASNQVTLPAGTYEIIARAPIYAGGDGHQAYLYNITDSADAILGTVGRSGNGVGNFSHSFIEGQITISAAKVFEVRHVVESGGGDALGAGYNSGKTNIYTVFKATKIS